MNQQESSENFAASEAPEIQGERLDAKHKGWMANKIKEILKEHPGLTAFLIAAAGTAAGVATELLLKSQNVGELDAMMHGSEVASIGFSLAIMAGIKLQNNKYARESMGNYVDYCATLPEQQKHEALENPVLVLEKIL